MTYTYMQTTDKNGKARFYRVDENGKRKVISRAEYEANSAEQVSMNTEETETAENCTALAIPFVMKTYEPEVAEDESTAPSVVVLTPSIPHAELEEIKEREHLNTIAILAPSFEEVALETAKSIIAATGSKHAKKVRLQSTKKGIQIRYRNCTVCTLEFDAEHQLTGYRFTGASVDTMHEVQVYAPNSLSTYAEDIAEQVAFIDWQWEVATKKAVA